MEGESIKKGCVKTLAELAEIIGVHRRNVTDWKKKEGFPIEADGTYDLYKVGYWRSERNSQSNKSELSLEGVDLNEMKARRIVAEALIAEEDAKAKSMRNRQSEGELISRVAVKQWVSRAFANLRQRCEAYPAEVATDFPEETRSDNVENFKRFMRLQMRKLASTSTSFEGDIE